MEKWFLTQTIEVGNYQSIPPHEINSLWNKFKQGEIVLFAKKPWCRAFIVQVIIETMHKSVTSLPQNELKRNDWIPLYEKVRFNESIKKAALRNFTKYASVPAELIVAISKPMYKNTIDILSKDISGEVSRHFVFSMTIKIDGLANPQLDYLKFVT